MYSTNLWSGCRCRVGNSEVKTTGVGAQGRDNCGSPSACWLSNARRSSVYRYLPSKMPIRLRTNPDSDPPPAGTDIDNATILHSPHQYPRDLNSTHNATPPIIVAQKNALSLEHERLNQIITKNETQKKQNNNNNNNNNNKYINNLSYERDEGVIPTALEETPRLSADGQLIILWSPRQKLHMCRNTHVPRKAQLLLFHEAQMLSDLQLC